jgi:cell division protein FtsW
METIAQISRYLLPVLGTAVLAYCLFSLFRRKPAFDSGAFLQNNANGDTFPMNYGETSIGRSKTCDIIFNYPTVSRSHAVLAQRKKGWIIIDTLSSTGTSVNGERVKRRVKLEDGDIITLGGISLVFCLASDTADIPVGKV